MPPLLHVPNGLVRPVDESMLARNIRTTGHSENVIASVAHDLRRTAQGNRIQFLNVRFSVK